MLQATPYREWDSVLVTLAEALNPGDLVQLRDGRAAYMKNGTAGNVGDQREFKASGQVTLAKAPNITLLNGGRAFWQRANSYISYAPTANSRDYYAGRIVGNAPASASNVVVNLNVDPANSYDLAVKPFTPTPVGTPAESLMLRRRGGAQHPRQHAQRPLAPPWWSGASPGRLWDTSPPDGPRAVVRAHGR